MGRLYWLGALGLAMLAIFGGNEWARLGLLLLACLVVPAWAIGISGRMVTGQATFGQGMVLTVLLGVLGAASYAVAWQFFPDASDAWWGIGAAALALGMWLGSKLLRTGLAATAFSLVLAAAVMVGVYLGLTALIDAVALFVEQM